MKRTLITLGLASLLVSAGPAAHAQLAVYDGASYAKLIEQATTALNQLNQLKAQVAQGQQLFASLNTASGVSGIATLLNAPSLRAFLPNSSVFGATGNVNLPGLGALGSSATAIRAATRLYTPAAGDAAGADLEAAGQRAALDLALGQSVSDAGAQRLTGLTQLQGAIDAAPNARAVLDIQARAATEQAMIANDQMRLQGLAMAQAAQDRLQAQRDRERMMAARDARMAAYQQAFR